MKIDKTYSIILLFSLIVLLAISYLIYGPKGTGGNEALNFIPAINAFFNSLAAVAVLVGIFFIKNKKQKLHKYSMLTAFLFSACFLISYLYYHFYVGNTVYVGDYRTIYLIILISHIAAAFISLPMILITFYLSLTGRFKAHRKIAKFTAPIWLYLSITGVIVFLFLKSQY